MSVAEMALSELRPKLVAFGCCSGTAVHDVPLKCRVSDVATPVALLTVNPMIQTSLADTAEIALPAAGVKLGSGRVTRLQVVPFQCSTKPLELPTAQASVELRSTTPLSC